MAVDKKSLQRRVIFKAIREPGFLDKLRKNRIELFKDNEDLATVYSALGDYYTENGSVSPSKDVLMAYVNGKLDTRKVPETERYGVTEAIEDIYGYSEDDQRVFDSQISDFIKREQILKSIKSLVANELTDKAIERFERDYEKIQLTSGDSGMHDFYSVFDEEQAEVIGNTIREVSVDKIPISNKVYNEATGGGLGRGELGSISAASGYGKTMNMANLAVSYEADGYNVLYIALEELSGQMFRRLSRTMLGKIDYEYPEILKGFKDSQGGNLDRLTWTNNIATMIEKKAYANIIKNYEQAKGNKVGELIFTRYSPKTVTVADLRQIISNVIVTQGKKIDVIFIDYPDLLSYDESAGESASGGRLYEELRAITQEFNTVMWVASQLNRTQANEDGLLTAKNVQGSFRKQNSAEAFLTINSLPKERSAGFTRIYVDKMRNATTATQVFSMKVDEFTNFLHEESEEEYAEHQSILNEKKEQPAYQKNLEEYQSNQDFTARVNRRNSI